MKKFAIFLFIIMFFTSVASAQEDIGARPVGMGGAFTGLADDVNAVFINPAGIAYLDGELASASTKISEGREYTIIGGVEKTAGGTVGVGYISSHADLAELDDSSTSDTPVSSISQTFLLSYGREFNDFMRVPVSMGRLSFGTNLRLTSFRVNNVNGLTNFRDSRVDLDLGAVFKPNDSLSLGLSVKDCFSNGYQVADAAPTEGLKVSGGVAGRVLSDRLIWSVEGESFGCEFRPVKAIALRAGRDGEYSTAGLGIKIRGFGFDYGFLGKEQPVHYVSVSMAIGKEPDMRRASID